MMFDPSVSSIDVLQKRTTSEAARTIAATASKRNVDRGGLVGLIVGAENGPMPIQFQPPHDLIALDLKACKNLEVCSHGPRQLAPVMGNGRNRGPECGSTGYWGIVFPDQYMWDPADLGVDSYEGIDSTLETWIALTHLAMKTTNIRLGTWVTPIPLRPPAMLAKIVSTVDLLSSGRVILGVGAGATQRMFEAYSQWDTPRVRVDKTREGVELILKLWTEKKVDYKGHYYKTKGAVLDPKPIQRPHPPLLFGGAGRRMLQLAGRYADICYVPPWNKMDTNKAREIVLAEAKRYNRQNQIRFAYAYTPLGPSQHYSREDYGKHVEEAAKNSYDYFITAFNMDAAPWEPEASTPKAMENYLLCLRDFAANVISSYDK